MVKPLVDDQWGSKYELPPKQYTCAYCDSLVGSFYGWSLVKNTNVAAYLCPFCNWPTFFNGSEQFPAPVYGRPVKHLPADVQAIYNEARSSISVNAYTGAVLLCRKLVMNVAVHLGADQNKPFTYYVDYLEANHHTPAGSKKWLDHIRQKGNEATHEIPSIIDSDARQLIDFCEMLLQMVFEYPERIKP